MEMIIVIALLATVPTLIELHRDGLHRLDSRDEWRGLGSHFRSAH